jgi:hypothetical protein
MGVLTLPACGQQDTADVVSADCSGHIPREKIDSCLERVRVVDETDPSVPLQSLEAQLEQRARHHDEAQSGPPPAADGPGQGPPPSYADDQGQPPPGYDPNQQPPPNYDAHDQMPGDQMPGDQNAPPDARPIPSHAYGLPPASHGPRELSAPDQPTVGDEMPPDDGPQGPPPDNTPPPDDSDTQGPN